MIYSLTLTGKNVLLIFDRKPPEVFYRLLFTHMANRTSSHKIGASNLWNASDWCPGLPGCYLFTHCSMHGVYVMFLFPDIFHSRPADTLWLRTDEWYFTFDNMELVDDLLKNPCREIQFKQSRLILNRNLIIRLPMCAYRMAETNWSIRSWELCGCHNKS